MVRKIKCIVQKFNIEEFKLIWMYSIIGFMLNGLQSDIVGNYYILYMLGLPLIIANKDIEYNNPT